MTNFIQMRSKRPGWAAAGRRSSLISALSGRLRFPVDFDELDETFDAEVGERHDAVVAEPLDPDPVNCNAARPVPCGCSVCGIGAGRLGDVNLR